MMYTLSTNYDLKWQIKNAENYKVSKCGRVINTLTGKEIKKTLNGNSVGFWIKRDFIPIKELRQRLEKIPNIECPF